MEFSHTRRRRACGHRTACDHRTAVLHNHCSMIDQERLSASLTVREQKNFDTDFPSALGFPKDA
jgi:hypothetical protein